MQGVGRGISEHCGSVSRADRSRPSGRIRLLEFLTTLAVGGTERHVVRLAQSLDLSRFELHLACQSREGGFLKEIERLGVPLAEYRINSLYKPGTFHQQWKLARYLRQNRIQVIHTYGFYSNVFAIPAAKLARTPAVIASIRDIGDYLSPMQKRVQRLVCSLADAVLANSDAVRERLVAEGYNPRKITVIRNGVDLDQFPGKAEPGKLHREFGLPASAPLVAVVSRLNRLKGIEYFLKAAAMVARRVPEARFLVVGRGEAPHGSGGDPYRAELESCAARLGLAERVVFTGVRLDVPAVLSEIAVSVLPSLSEGLPNVLLESMATGVPVVATRVGGNPEVVEDCVTGFLVPPRDPLALARAIGDLLENPDLAAGLGRAGRRHIADHFSMEQMVRKTERFYRNLLERRQDRSREVGTLSGYPSTWAGGNSRRI